MSSAVNEPSVKGRQTIPPLENGDRLTRAEFERHYDAMPQLKKAELIERSPTRSASSSETSTPALTESTHCSATGRTM